MTPGRLYARSPDRARFPRPKARVVHLSRLRSHEKTATHLAIWIDQEQARIVQVRRGQPEAAGFGKSDAEVLRRRPRMLAGGSDRRGANRFFARVTHSIQKAKQILLLGPFTAKLDFARYLRKHEHALERKIVGIETMARPSDGQLHAFTQEYFPAKRPREDHRGRPSNWVDLPHD